MITLTATAFRVQAAGAKICVWAAEAGSEVDHSFDALDLFPAFGFVFCDELAIGLVSEILRQQTGSSRPVKWNKDGL